jgi:hypothetical protein
LLEKDVHIIEANWNAVEISKALDDAPENFLCDGWKLEGSKSFWSQRHAEYRVNARKGIHNLSPCSDVAV